MGARDETEAPCGTFAADVGSVRGPRSKAATRTRSRAPSRAAAQASGPVKLRRLHAIDPTRLGRWRGPFFQRRMYLWPLGPAGPPEQLPELGACGYSLAACEVARCRTTDRRRRRATECGASPTA